jgi:hypothetical protein
VKKTNDFTTSKNIKTETTLKCYNCQKPGHKSINCPDPQKKPRCAKCFRVGHSESECRVRDVTKPTPTVHVIATGDDDKKSDNESTIEVDIDGMIKTSVIIGNHVVAANALVDSGSAVSVLKFSKIKNYNLSLLESNILVKGVNNSIVDIKGKLKSNLIYNDQIYPINLLIVNDNIAEVEMIIGRDFINENKFSNVRIKN